MEKSKAEEYFLEYPKVDEEIIKLKAEISSLENEKSECESRMDEFSIGLLLTINAALESAKIDLKKAFETKSFVTRALSIMDLRQKKIVELRFWSGHTTPVGWEDVAGKMKYHKKSVEKIYRGMLKRIPV